MENIYDVYAEKYDEWFEKNELAYQSELNALKELVPEDGKGLEIGVGTGRFAKPLNVSVGVDPSWKMLEIAAKRKVKVFFTSGEELSFNDDEFDYVLMVTTLCFVENPDKVIEEARRVLKSKGKIIIGIIDRESFLGRYYEIRKAGNIFYEKARFFSARWVMKLLRKNKFVNLKVCQTLFHTPEDMKEVDVVEKGYGKGGFVVIRGEKA